MHWKQELIAVAGSLVLGLPAFGQAGMSGAAGTPPDQRSTPERQTSGTTAERAAHPMGSSAALVFLHHVNQNEIEIANLAKDRSGNKAVKDYADMIITDHKKADDEVQSFAKAHNIDLKQAEQEVQAIREKRREAIDDELRSRAVQSPTGEYMRPLNAEALAGMGSKHKKALEDLGKLKGPEFDREFAKTMTTDHHNAIERLQNIRSRESDRDLGQLIDKLMPTLQKHETMAKQLEASVSRAS